MMEIWGPNWLPTLIFPVLFVKQIVIGVSILLLTQRREQRLQDQLSNPHYLKPSAAASSRASGGGGGRAGESTGLTESSGLTAIDASKIPVQKLELGIGLIIGRSSIYTRALLIDYLDTFHSTTFTYVTK